MEVYNIGIFITAIIPPTVVTTMKFMMKQFFQCLWLMEDVCIGLLIPATLPLLIVEVSIVVMLVEVYLCHSIPSTLPITII